MLCPELMEDTSESAVFDLIVINREDLVTKVKSTVAKILSEVTL